MSFAKAKRFDERPVEVTPSPADYYIATALDKGVKIPRTGRDESSRDESAGSVCDRLERSNRRSSLSYDSSSSKSDRSDNDHFRRCCSSRRSKSSDASSRRLSKHLAQQHSSQKVYENSPKTPTNNEAILTKGDARRDTPFKRCYSCRPKSRDALSPQEICDKFLTNGDCYSSFTGGSFMRSSARKSSRKAQENRYKSPNDDNDSISFEFSEEFIDDDYDVYISREELDELHELHRYECDEVIKEMRRLREEAFNSSNNYNDATTESQRSSFSENEHNEENNEKNAQVLLDDTILAEHEMTLVPVDYFEDGVRTPKKSKIMRIIKSGIEKLKKEFKQEIYKKTEKKLSELGNMFQELRLKNDDDIDEKCKYTVSSIGHKIDKVVHKQTSALERSYKSLRKSKRFGRN